MVGKVTPNDMATASVAPVLLMKAHPYMTKNELLKQCLEARQGIEPAFQGNEATGWGDRLERIVLQTAVERLGLSDAVLDIDKPAFHPDIPLACSLDGAGQGDGQTITADPSKGIYVIGGDSIVLDGDGVLECKVTSVKPEDMPALHRGPIQMQAQMMCCEYKWGALCILYRGIELRIFLFEAHAGTQAAIADAVNDFDLRLNAAGGPEWYDIEHPTDPRIIFTEDDGGEVPVILDEDAAKTAEEIEIAKKGIKYFEEVIEQANLHLQAMMGNHALAYAGSFEIKWGTRNYKAQPEKVTPAKPARSERAKTVTVKRKKDAA